MCSRVSQGVEILYMQLHFHALTQVPHKRFVAITLCAPKVKITMCYDTFIPCVDQHIQQSYTVCAAAYGYQHRLVFDQQTPLANICRHTP